MSELDLQPIANGKAADELERVTAAAVTEICGILRAEARVAASCGRSDYAAQVGAIPNQLWPMVERELTADGFYVTWFHERDHKDIVVGWRLWIFWGENARFWRNVSTGVPVLLTLAAISIILTVLVAAWSPG